MAESFHLEPKRCDKIIKKWKKPRGGCGTKWARRRRPTANIESKSSAKSLKRLDSSTWKLCLPARLIIIRRIIVYFPLNVARFGRINRLLISRFELSRSLCAAFRSCLILFGCFERWAYRFDLVFELATIMIARLLRLTSLCRWEWKCSKNVTSSYCAG